MIVMPVMLARRALWLLSLLLLLISSVMPAAANSVSMGCKGLFNVEMPTNAHEMNIWITRVSSRVQVNWHWHEVRDYLPLGAIQSIKKRYSDHKLFTADCDVMRQRLF